ncbi:MAG: complex I NDUFA9 subunit family protein [Alphaproteobacteria bacterium]|nr:complex I NDUFA9 subunit family protein [Alphaproteobacteria bacterium]
MAGNNSEKLITVVGGSGFVGRHVVRSLAKRGYRIRVACRRPDLAGHLVPLGVPGQIVPVQANVRYPASLAAACAGAFAVINLTAVFSNAGGQTFEAVHEFGATAIAGAAKAAKAQLFIHMSGLGTDKPTTSVYVKSRAKGEANAAAGFPGAIIMRPSVVFGPEDRLFNKFAVMARFSPVLPLIGGGETKFQPVFVGDVAEAIATLVDRGVADGKVYELGGPEVMSFKQILQYVLETVQRKRLLLPIPFGVASLMGIIAGLLPNPALTADQVELLKSDNLVDAKAQTEGRTLAGLGIAARSVETIVPSYLYRFRKAGQFSLPNVKPE